jgi:hypothetical protein
VRTMNQMEQMSNMREMREKIYNIYTSLFLLISLICLILTIHSSKTNGEVWKVGGFVVSPAGFMLAHYEVDER